ncbi:MAG: HD domain-containing protein [Planctomycetales bacterium]|nr:HD domain-containing protein [Planctomycetales bacterium]NIM08498.1 HD domain-containing protein [Planctomycetales bacterium]NIN07975.1 HD domain-containing protein [Planctomycetales bacterium]NIN77104.1 HD domain-containing protein [Planctomycetales bacterium]NIO34284.1 HD domain-containing protein [Planctomycetales bacterium]
MGHRFVKELNDKESVDDIFLVSEKQLRSNRQGNLYLQCELSDKTGSVGARMWNAGEEVADGFHDGDFVRVQGTTQVYQGALQLIATKINKVAVNEVAEQDYRRLTTDQIQRLTDRLRELLGNVTDPALAAVAESFLADEQWMDKFTRAPAGVKNHHAYQGGLLEHVVQLLEIITRIADLYPELDRDLLLLSALLHDSGKVDELGYERQLSYTSEGQLLGHIVMGVELLDRKLDRLARQGVLVPAETVLRLKHIIVSHHGSLEFGSPAVPMTVEAVALHYLDNLDAKIHHFASLLREDANVDSEWTQYHPNLGRKLYRGSIPNNLSPAQAPHDRR